MSETPFLKRIGLLGDPHGAVKEIEAALTFLETVGSLDAICCTGDVVAKKSGDTNQTATLLREADVFTVRGNHDRWLIESITDPTLIEMGLSDTTTLPDTCAFLKSLPRTLSFETPNGALLLCHGLAEKDTEGIYPGGNDGPIADVLNQRRLPERYRYMIAGHTHFRMVRHVAGMTILNPGTLIWDEKPGFAVVDFIENTVQFYDIEPFERHVSVAAQFSLLNRAME